VVKGPQKKKTKQNKKLFLGETDIPARPISTHAGKTRHLRRQLPYYL
jgi:hypothetical protein